MLRLKCLYFMVITLDSYTPQQILLKIKSEICQLIKQFDFQKQAIRHDHHFTHMSVERDIFIIIFFLLYKHPLQWFLF